LEESFEFGEGCFGLDQCQARLYTAICWYTVLVMAALAVRAVRAVTAAVPRNRAGTPAQQPHRRAPAAPGLIPLTVREVKCLLAAALWHLKPPGHAARWPE
jgi:hypothetical protein